MTTLQNLIVAVIVLAAAAWLARRVYRTIVAATREGASACDACGHCDQTASKKSPEVVSIGPRRRHHQGQ
ncbi:MAG: FeoB-associated Cys-rich membrane protein [Planctomycetaceae bacterium]